MNEPSGMAPAERVAARGGEATGLAGQVEAGDLLAVPGVETSVAVTVVVPGWEMIWWLTSASMARRAVEAGHLVVGDDLLGVGGELERATFLSKSWLFQPSADCTSPLPTKPTPLTSTLTLAMAAVGIASATSAPIVTMYFFIESPLCDGSRSTQRLPVREDIVHSKNAMRLTQTGRMEPWPSRLPLSSLGTAGERA